MKLRSLFVVTVFFLLFCLHLTQPGQKKTLKKPGYCPEFLNECPFKMISMCRQDSGCKKAKKCCFYDCRYQCMEPWNTLN